MASAVSPFGSIVEGVVFVSLIKRRHFLKLTTMCFVFGRKKKQKRKEKEKMFGEHENLGTFLVYFFGFLGLLILYCKQSELMVLLSEVGLQTQSIEDKLSSFIA